MQTYQEIVLSKITTNPLNPRENFSGKDFDKFTESIRQNGVIQAILCRPKNGGFELVAGERRLKAAIIVAKDNGGPDKNTIPVIIKDLTDQQAFDHMMIENLQRENLTEFEEAQGFSLYLKGKDDSQLEQLAKRTGLNPGYIRRRAAVMDLPKKYLAAWKKGDLYYGHLEIFIRIEPKSQRDEYFESTTNYGWSVSTLKSELMRRSPRLKNALFNKKTLKCSACFHNSSKQKVLFALDEKEKNLKCQNLTCFLVATKTYLEKYWKHTKFAKQFKTNGYVFDHETSWDKYEIMRTPISTDCVACEKFVTIVDINRGEADEDKVCINKTCYAKHRAANNKALVTKGGAAGQKTVVANAPRVAWHGEYFREKFYEAVIPQKFKAIKPDSAVAGRMAVLCLMKSNSDLETWYCQKFGLKRKRLAQIIKDGWGSPSLTDAEIFAPIVKMTTKKLDELIKEIAVESIVQKGFAASGRKIVADHIGISLAKEWQMDDEYLAKKTKVELIDIGTKFKVFKQPKVEKYIHDKFGKKDISSVKKTQLIDAFLKSGANLAGVVPKEILT